MSWKDSLPASAKAYIGERQLDEVECIISDFPGVARGKAVPASKFAKQEHFYLPNSIFLQTLTGEWAEAAGEEGWVELQDIGTFGANEFEQGLLSDLQRFQPPEAGGAAEAEAGALDGEGEW